MRTSALIKVLSSSDTISKWAQINLVMLGLPFPERVTRHKVGHDYVIQSTWWFYQLARCSITIYIFHYFPVDLSSTLFTDFH